MLLPPTEMNLFWISLADFRYIFFENESKMLTIISTSVLNETSSVHLKTYLNPAKFCT